MNQKCFVSRAERDVRLTTSSYAKARNDDHKADKTLVVRSESTSIRIVSQQTVGLECGNGKCACSHNVSPQGRLSGYAAEVVSSQYWL